MPSTAASPPLRASPNGMDAGDEAPTLLHAQSVYLDSRPNAFDEFSDSVRTADLVAPDVQEAAKARQKTREGKAQRLAAEQCVWVRQKFNLPSKDQFIASFSAALVKHIMLQGRIYIMTSGICFYAKIFGKITKEFFPFANIARVKKRRGGFVANALKIYFVEDGPQAAVIGSLNNRERAFALIQTQLREVNPGAAETRETDEFASANSIANSQNGDSEDPSFDGDDFVPDARGTIVRVSHKEAEIRPSQNDLPPIVSRIDPSKSSSDSDELSLRICSDSDAVRLARNDEPDSPVLVWRTQHDIVDRVHGKAFAKKTERARGVLNAPVKEVFNIIFVSEWLKHYHDSNNNRDVTFTGWFRGEDGFMVREVNFRRPLGYKIGPKETRVKETQRYSFTAEGGVIIELEGHNLDAPYGDYFTCESYFELVPQSDCSTTLLTASIAVHFNKSTILRGKIESGALSETKTSFQKLFNMASGRIEEHLSSCGRRRETPECYPITSPKRKMRPTEECVPDIGCIAAKREPAHCVPELQTSGSLMSGASRYAGPPAPMNPTLMPNIAEVRDSEPSRMLRMGSVIALGLACFLLLCILIALFRMRADLRELEMLVAKASRGSSGGMCSPASYPRGVTS